MADDFMSGPELSATQMDLIDSMVQSYLQEESVMIPLVMDKSALAGKGVKSIALPRAGGFTVNDKANKTAVDAQTTIFSNDQLNLDKHKVIQFIVEDRHDMQARINTVQESLLRASKDMALQVDIDIITELATTAQTVSQTGGVGGFGVVAYNKGDIVELRKELRKEHLNVRELKLLVNPDREAELLQIDHFIRADHYGSSAVPNGMLGSLYGVEVFAHTEVDNEASLCFHKDAVAYASQMGMRVQTDLDLANLGRRYSVDMLYGTKLLDSGNRVRKLIPAV